MTGKLMSGLVAARDRRPTVSVLLCNYNHAKYLPQSLGAICQQTEPPDEVIVVDDGSTDSSIDVIQRFARDHPFVRPVRNERNQGLLVSIGRALEQASGDYVAWAAADDVLLPTFLERNLALLSRHQGAGVSFSRLATLDDQTSSVREYRPEALGPAFDLGDKPHFLTPGALRTRLRKSYVWMSGNTVLARRDALLEAGGFRPELRWHADWFAFYVVALRHGACVLPETLALLRTGHDTYSRRGMSRRKLQSHVLTALAGVIKEPRYRDVAGVIRARPALLSPFGGAMLRATIAKPACWALGWRYLQWSLAHWAAVFQARADGGWKNRTRLSLQATLCDGSARLMDILTPASWKD